MCRFGEQKRCCSAYWRVARGGMGGGEVGQVGRDQMRPDLQCGVGILIWVPFKAEEGFRQGLWEQTPLTGIPQLSL